jgi:hypothetical protein
MSNSRKLFVISMLLLLVQSLCVQEWAKSPREYWSAYFKVIKGKEFSLDKDCLSGKFNEYFEDLNKALLTSDVVQIVWNINRIFNLESSVCPFEEYSTILRDFNTALRNGTLMKNIMKNSSLIKEKVQMYIQSDRSACALGTCIGEVTKIVTYGTSFSSWKDEHHHNENSSTYKNGNNDISSFIGFLMN